MSIDIVSNNALTHLNQVKEKQNLSNNIFQDITDNFDIGPAYIVELSAKGKQLQQDHPVNIVRL
jgi:hypothetical protein